MTVPRSGGVARRAVVFGGLGLALTACAAEPSKQRADPAPTRTEPAPTAEPTPQPTTDPPVDVEAVIAEHEGRLPTQWGTDISGVVRTGADAGLASSGDVYLTLDACGGPAGSGYDESLIAGLVDAGVPATLFLNRRWIEANSDTAAQLARLPQFSIQNHGTAHLPLSVTGEAAYGIPGTPGAREAAMEVWENHLALTELTGTAPRWFRPGTAHLDDVGLSIAEALGERIAGFAVNADGGATLPAESVAAELGAVGGGEIVIAHMNQPGSGTAAGILQMIAPLRDRGITFGRLA
ncbi:MAG: polysaccharide deacetylase family protein [Leucobacter sp.]